MRLYISVVSALVALNYFEDQQCSCEERVTTTTEFPGISPLPLLNETRKALAGFPTDEEYLELADNATAMIKELAEEDLSEWPEVERESEMLTIRRREPPVSNVTEKAIMAVFTVNCNQDKLTKLLTPWGEYRLKFDSELYEDIRPIKKIDDNTYVLRHMVKKKLILSPRDSIDAYGVSDLHIMTYCKWQLRHYGNNTVVLGSQGTTHPDWPEQDGYTRTVQRLGGYYLRPNATNSNFTDVKLVFIADLNLPVPSFMSSLAEKFKPGQLEEAVERIQNAATTIDVQ